MAIAFNAEYGHLAGSANAGLFLSQVLYWATRGKDGWFYKTQAEWTKETCLTRYEQEGARKKLRALGVLKEKRVGIPRKLYYAVDQARLDELLQQARELETTTHVCGKPAHKREKNHHTITEITHKTTSETTFKAATYSVALIKEKENSSESSMANANDILKQLKEKEKTVQPGNIYTLWQKTCASVAGGFQKPLTMKDMGQIKRFAKIAGEHAHEALKYTIVHWWAFTTRAKADAGLEFAPLAPDPGFLVKHVGVAMTLFLQSVAKNGCGHNTESDGVVSSTAIVCQEKQATPASNPVESKQEVYQPSQAEIDKLLADLKGE